MVDQTGHFGSVVPMSRFRIAAGYFMAGRTGARVLGVDLTEQMLRQWREWALRVGRAGSASLPGGRAAPLPDASVDA
jgi:hypothetical protein